LFTNLITQTDRQTDRQHRVHNDPHGLAADKDFSPSLNVCENIWLRSGVIADV